MHVGPVGGSWRGKGAMMARLVFGMNQSLDGYVDHTEFAPDSTLFRHFVDEARGQTGSLYGRRTYELMRYWEEDDPRWGTDEQAFAAAWRAQRKWVVSRSQAPVDPGAALLKGDLAGAGSRPSTRGRSRWPAPSWRAS